MHQFLNTSLNMASWRQLTTFKRRYKLQKRTSKGTLCSTRTPALTTCSMYDFQIFKIPLGLHSRQKRALLYLLEPFCAPFPQTAGRNLIETWILPSHLLRDISSPPKQPPVPKQRKGTAKRARRLQDVPGHQRLGAIKDLGVSLVLCAPLRAESPRAPDIQGPVL